MSVVTTNHTQQQLAGDLSEKKNRFNTFPKLNAEAAERDGQQAPGAAQTTGTAGGTAAQAPIPSGAMGKPRTAPAPKAETAKPTDKPKAEEAKPLEFSQAPRLYDILEGVPSRQGTVDVRTVQPMLGFIEENAKIRFKALHEAAQERGEITKIGSPDSPQDRSGLRPLQGNNFTSERTVGVWDPDWRESGPNGRTTAQIVESLTKEPPRVVAKFSQTMRELGLPGAPRDEDVIRGVALFKQAYEEARAQWNTLTPTLSKEATAKGEQDRQAVIRDVILDLREEIRNSSRVAPSSASGVREGGSAAPQQPQAAPAGNQAGQSSQNAGPQETFQNGRFLTPQEIEANRSGITQQALQTLTPEQFSRSAAAVLRDQYFDKKYYDQRSKDIRAGVQPNGESWVPEQPATLDPRWVGVMEKVVPEFESRRLLAQSRNEDPSIYELREENGRFIADRTALVAVVTQMSYAQADRYSKALTGKPKFGGHDRDDFREVAQEMNRYSLLFREAERDSADTIAKLNKKHLNDDFSAYDKKALQSYFDETMKAMQKADEAWAKAYKAENAGPGGGGSGGGWGGITGNGFGVQYNPQPGVRYGFFGGRIYATGGPVTIR